MQPLAELAGFFAAHGIGCVSDGGPLVPMLAFERPDGSRQMLRLTAEQLEDGVAHGRNWLSQNPEGATRAVLVVDGYVSLESGKADALSVEAVRYVPSAASFSMAVPYRNPEAARGFAVFRPKFLRVEGVEPDFNCLGEAFFVGVDGHEKGAEVWTRHIDQSLQRSNEAAQSHVVARVGDRPSAGRLFVGEGAEIRQQTAAGAAS